jgi:hypothetical protein
MGFFPTTKMIDWEDPKETLKMKRKKKGKNCYRKKPMEFLLVPKEALQVCGLKLLQKKHVKPFLVSKECQ